MYKKLILFLLVFSFLLYGCATIFSGSTQKISYSSEPSGAQVYVNGQYMGDTPFELNMRKNKSYTIEFKKEGYSSKSVLINNNIGAGWLVLDVLGGLIPVIIDAATGNWCSLNPENVRAILESQQKDVDVIHFKNGAVVKGHIIENVTNNYVKIKLLDGSVAAYSYSDIDKITKK